MSESSEGLSLVELLYLQWLRDGRSWADWCEAHPEFVNELEALHRRSGTDLHEPRESDDSQSVHTRLAERLGGSVDPKVQLRSEPESGGSNDLLGRLQGGPSSSRYLVAGEVGKGGMGEVLRVWDADLRRHLAMKVMLDRDALAAPPEASAHRKALERFLEEAQVTGQLEHPGIVPVHELGLDDRGRVYFTMKLVRGKTLGQVFDERSRGEGGWTLHGVLGLLHRVCEAMRYAHDKGVIHRDLKPANIMVGKYGEVYVMDWGLARVVGRAHLRSARPKATEAASLTAVRSNRRDQGSDEPDSPLLTMDGDVLGTPAYMPPEQALGQLEELGPASDVYAVGAILYHLLAGQIPYVVPGAQIDNYVVLRWVQEGPPKRLQEVSTEVPAELASICERAMARDLSERYADMGQLAADLKAYLEGRVVAAHEGGAWPELRKWIGRNKGLASAIGSVILLLVVGLMRTTQLKNRADGLAHDAALNAQLAAENAAAASENAERARQNEDLARSNEEAAVEQALLAEARADEIELQQYVANFQMAKSWFDRGELNRAYERLSRCPTRLRGWEWGWLHGMLDSSLRVFEEEGGVYAGAAWMGDGTRFLTRGFGEIGPAVWDSVSGEKLQVIAQGDGIVVEQPVSVSPGGSQVAIGHRQEATVEILRVDSGERLRTLELASLFESSLLAQPVSLLFSPDETKLAVGSPRRESTLWDIATGSLDGRFSLRSESNVTSAYSMAFDSTGLWFALASGLSLSVFNTTTGELIFEKTDPRNADDAWQRRTEQYGGASELTPLATMHVPQHSPPFFGGGDRLALSSLSTTEVWDIAERKRVITLPTHLTNGFGRDDEECLLGFSKDRAELWRLEELANGNPTPTVTLDGHQGWVTTARMSPYGDSALTGGADRTVRLWEMETGLEKAVYRGHRTEVLSVAFSPDESQILSSSSESVRLWDGYADRHSETPQRRTLHLRERQKDGIEELEVIFAKDGSRIFACLEDVVRVWDGVTFELVMERAFPSCGTAIEQIAISSDGRWCVSGPHEDAVAIWDCDTGETEWWSLGDAFVQDVVVHPDDEQVVVAASDGAIYLGRRGELPQRYQVSADPVETVVLSKSGERLLTMSKDGTVRVFATESLSSIATFQNDRRWGLQTDSDLNFVLTFADGKAIVRSVGSGDIVLEGARTEVLSLDPTGSLLLTGSAFGQEAGGGASLRNVLLGKERMILWDLQTGESRPAFNSAGAFAVFDQTGRRVISCRMDGTAKLFDVATGKALMDFPMHAPFYDIQFTANGERLLMVTVGARALILESTPYRERFPAIDAGRVARVEVRPQVHAKLQSGMTPADCRQWIVNEAAWGATKRTAALAILQDEESDRRARARDLNDRATELLGGDRQEEVANEAIELAATAVALWPENWNFRQTLARAQFGAGRQAEAILEMNRARDLTRGGERQRWQEVLREMEAAVEGDRSSAPDR